jgi:hypothetical protein
MTRKHFTAIADMFACEIDNEADSDARRVKQNLANEMASVLANFNENFDRERFLDACHADGTLRLMTIARKTEQGE